MTTTLYLIRHGEVYNPDQILYGRIPGYGLSEKGIQQAEQTAAFLADKNISSVISSPLLRARQTAEIIQRRLALLTNDIAEETLEIRTEYQGRPLSSLDSVQSDPYFKPLSPSDETIPQIAERMSNFFKKQIADNQGESLAMVGHGDPLMILKAVLQKKPVTFESFKIQNGPYIAHGEIWKVITENNDDFLVESVFKPNIH